MEDTSPTYKAAAEILTRGESHRVWSLIVTIFGDMARNKGDRISGAALTRLVGLMGVKPEAMRVALHRLRKDGWIDSAREGRGSLHFLTAFGRRQSDAASPRIYDRVRDLPGTWHMLVAGTGEQTGRAQLDAVLLTGDYLPVGSQVVLGLGPLPDDLRGLMGAELSALCVPDWLRDQVCPADLMDQYRRFQTDLTQVLDILGPEPRLPIWEQAALRLLIVHSWRRLLFRHPDLPSEIFPQTWPGAACRALFSEAMDRLPVPSLALMEPVG